VGKPFSQELLDLDATLAWTSAMDVSALADFIDRAAGRPLVCVGVGGSFTAARMAAQLHEMRGGVAAAKTTLEFSTSGARLRNANVILFTGGGRNGDVLRAFDHATQSEPNALLVVCARKDSPIAQRAAQAGGAQVFEFAFPARGDGFLATNSLLATCALLVRACGQEIGEFSSRSPQNGNERTIEKWVSEGRETFLVLHSGWGTPAAVDLESKCSEAALRNVLLSDYRHFAHGRHLWLAKRARTSAIVAFVTPADQDLATRTLAVLPKSIPQLRLESPHAGPRATIDLLIRTFHICAALGRAVGIDPGRPGVPPFGSRIYHLGKGRTVARAKHDVLPSVVLERKGARAGERGLFAERAAEYLTRLSAAAFSAVVCDFDGTLCNSSERMLGIHAALREPLVDLLRHGVLLGIATGRGKSARRDLRDAIPRKYWPRVWVGYYNGSQIAPLSGDEPETVRGISPTLRRAAKALRDLGVAEHGKLELRPHQLTLSECLPAHAERIRGQAAALIARDFRSLHVVQSSHSLDILEAKASKMHVLEACRREAPGDILCIGDRGDPAGNDFELLSTPFSLSVDKTSPLLDSCWNFAPAGVSCAAATLFYLVGLETKKGLARFSLARSLTQHGALSA
jgi:hypothetical protein